MRILQLLLVPDLLSKPSDGPVQILDLGFEAFACECLLHFVLQEF